MDTILHKQICDELNVMYEAKNADYGDSFSKTFEEYGLIAPIIRLEDKLNRLKSLEDSYTPKVSNESIRDTLLDIANYAILTIMEISKTEEGLCYDVE